VTVVPPNLEQLREARAWWDDAPEDAMYIPEYDDAISDALDWLLSVLDEGGRLERVVLCEHGFDESHRVFTDALGMERCAKGSRTVVWPGRRLEGRP